MTVEELKAARLYRQHLTAPTDLHTAARDVLGVQAQFFGNALHALRIRVRDFDSAAVGRDLVKSWTIRGTLHLFDPDDLPLFLHEGRTRFLRPCDTMEEDKLLTAARKEYFAEVILEKVQNGEGERETLRLACRAAGMTPEEEVSAFNAWGGLLRALCENGSLLHCAGEKKTFVRCPPFRPMGRDEAEREQVRRYFAHFGPAAPRDAAYFFGWTQERVRRHMETLPIETVSCAGRDYYSVGETAAGEIPDCLFLAGFDQLLLGYQKTESVFLPPEHLRGIFNRAGIVMPAVLLRGRIVGKWKREKKRLFVTLFETVPAKDRAEIINEAARLWDDVPVQFES